MVALPCVVATEPRGSFRLFGFLYGLTRCLGAFGSFLVAQYKRVRTSVKTQHDVIGRGHATKRGHRFVLRGPICVFGRVGVFKRLYPGGRATLQTGVFCRATTVLVGTVTRRQGLTTVGFSSFGGVLVRVVFQGPT